MDNIETLRNKANDAQQALWAAEARQRDIDNTKVAGRCFKYRNSGCGLDKKWWLYVKILRVDNGNLRGFKFQQYSSGHIEIDPDDSIYHASILNDSSYIEIEPSEFDREWTKLRALIVAYEISCDAEATPLLT